MSKGLESGGLAMIIGSTHCPENIGKVVTLVRRIPPHTSATLSDGVNCTIEPFACWVVAGNELASHLTLSGFVRGRKEIRLAEHNLMPLRDDDTDAQQEQHAPIEMEVA